MEKHPKTTEQLYDKAEKKFVTRTLRAAVHELAERKGINPHTESPLLDFCVQDSYVDVQTGIHHGYMFHPAYEPEMGALTYYLSHTEAIRRPFDELEPALQDRLLAQVQALHDQDDDMAEIDPDYYLKTIANLRKETQSDHFSDDEDQSEPTPEVMYTEVFETQYKTEEMSCYITKKVLIQQLLDGNVLSEVVIGTHADEASEYMPSALVQEKLTTDGAEDVDATVMHTTDQDTSSADMDDLDVMREYLYHLNLIGGKLITPIDVDLHS